MFVLPHLPPKDHVIKNIPRNLLSCQEFTPNAKLRVTLPEIGVHAVPIEATITDPPPQVPLETVNPAVVSTWVARDRYNWLVRPGKEDYFLHDMYKKHNVVGHRSYDIRYQHAPPVFPRSFKYELECMEAFRLKKLEKKMLKDKEADTMKQQNIQLSDNEKEEYEHDMPKPAESTYESSYTRWQPQPHLFAPSQTDPCKRRSEFGLIGRPFKSEACNWYYKNYPPPDIKWLPEKFS